MPFTLPEASIEQQRVITSVLGGNNVKVEAVAGAGKTTLALQTCVALHAAFPAEQVVLATYNANLKHEAKQKIKQLGLRKTDAHTIHSLACAAYRPGVWNDDKMYSLVKDLQNPGAVPLKRKYTTTTLLILDELQDMDALLYKFVLCFMRDVRRAAQHNVCDYDYVCSEEDEDEPNNTSRGEPSSKAPALRIMVCGDVRQMINGYRGADERYLSLAPQVFRASSTRPWMAHTLTTSYRLTPHTARFVNEIMLNRKDALVAGNMTVPSVAVEYLRVGPNSIAPLIRRLEEHMGNGESVALLAHSVKFSPFATDLVNKCASLPWFVNYSSDNSGNGSAKMFQQNKVVFITKNGCKGLEFDYVYNICCTTNFTVKTEEKACNNLEYVACTRARRHLVLLDPLRGTRGSYPRMHATYDIWCGGTSDVVDVSDVHALQTEPQTDATCLALADAVKDTLVCSSVDDIVPLVARVSGERAPNPPRYKLPEINRQFAVTELTTHANGVEMQKICDEELVVTTTVAPQTVIEYTSHVTFTYNGHNIVEDVSSFYGTMIPCIVEFERTGKCSIMEQVEAHIKNLEVNHTGVSKQVHGRKEYERLKAMVGDVNARNRASTHATWAQIAVLYEMVFTGFKHTNRQILHYDWVNTDAVNAGTAALHHFLNQTEEKEQPYASGVAFEVPVEFAGLCGSIDYAVRRSLRAAPLLVELKFVSELSVSHMLQVATYLALWQSQHEVHTGTVRAQLFNVRTQELRDVRVRDPAEFLMRMIKNKQRSEECMDAQEFLQRAETDQTAVAVGSATGLV